MILNLTSYSSKPLHEQIVCQILDRILQENKLPGDELESINTISRQHHISKTSVNKAFSKLKLLGVIKEISPTKHVINDISTKGLKTLIERNNDNGSGYSEYDLIKTELEAARQIQNDLLPPELPNNLFVESSAYSTLSEEVGGDFYDIFEISENMYGIIIGDASGNGLPAALLISQIQAIIKSDLNQNRSLENTFFLLNSYLNTYTSAKHFATIFYGVLDLNKQKLEYINSGHNFPYLINSTHSIKKLHTTGPALGIMSNTSFIKESVEIENNSILFVYTDGLVETMNNSSEQFGEKRIQQILLNNLSNPSSIIIEQIQGEVNQFCESNSVLDDTTYIAVKVKNLERINS